MISYETLPYKNPLPVRNKVLTENTFLKIDMSGKTFFFSVLPGFHEASIHEIGFKINAFFSKYTLDLRNIDLTKRFFNMIVEDDFSKSIKAETLFCIESLLLSKLQLKKPELDISPDNILINSLYLKNSEPQSKCLKIKITPNEDISSLLTYMVSKNPEMRFRLDGNRRFELTELIAFCEAIPKIYIKNIDYIEEPLKNFYDTFLFTKRVGITIAMDESFSQYIDQPEYKENYPVVIKPSLFGISPVYKWLNNNPHVRAIISSSFEHSTVMLGLYFLAAKRPLEFHGLQLFTE